MSNKSEFIYEDEDSWNAGNICCHYIQNHLSSCVPFRNLMIKTYITIILPVAIDGCEIWFLTLREGQIADVWEESAEIPRYVMPSLYNALPM